MRRETECSASTVDQYVLASPIQLRLTAAQAHRSSSRGIADQTPMPNTVPAFARRHTTLWRAIIALALLVCGYFLLRVTWYIARLPESNCETRTVEEVPSSDHNYRAVLLQKNCNSGETYFHELTITSPSGVIRALPLEADQMHPSRPTLSWTAPHVLEVSIPTDKITGALTEQWEGGLELRRRWVPNSKEGP